MRNQTKNASISEFLAVMAGSKEIGLAIAKDNKELESFAQAMDDMDFKHVEEISDLVKFPKTYLTVREDMDKNVYDFAVQYPTGQVEIFDKELMRSQTFSPDYKNLSLVFLVAKDDLNKLQTKGFELLSCVGPAYQS